MPEKKTEKRPTAEEIAAYEKEMEELKAAKAADMKS